MDRTGRFLLAANYGSGSVAVFPILEDGRLGEASCVIQHEGRSRDPKRQAGPHAHSINLDPSNRFALVADLGIDRVVIYRFDSSQGRLIPTDKPWIATRPGSGPRHLAFHPHRSRCYLINELDSTMTALHYNEAQGQLDEIQTVTTLPSDYSGANTCADVHLDASGRFLYGSNRGHDSIVIFRIDQDTGGLRLIGHEPTQGKKPRNFAIEPGGEFLLAANQDSDSVVTFRIDHDSGLLEPTGQVLALPAPVCLLPVSFPPQ